jgi:hypothetical protein
LSLPAGFALVSGANPQAIGTINDGAAAPAAWTILAPTTLGAATFNWTHTSTSYGEDFGGVGSVEIEVGLPGDFNNDASLNGGDINGFISCVLTGVGCEVSDMDGDGNSADVDVAEDMAAFVSALLVGSASPCP